MYRNYWHNNKYNNNNNNKSWTFCLSVLDKDLFTNSHKIYKDRLIFISPKISLKLYTNVFYILCTSLWCQIPYRSSHNYDQWLSEKWRDTRQNHALKTWRIFAALRRISNDLESTTYIWGGKTHDGLLERFTSFTWADFERGSATWTVSSGGSRQEFLSMLTLAFIAASSSASRVLRRS